MPLAGAMCTFTAMLMAACRPNSSDRPVMAKRVKGSSSSMARDSARRMMKANSARMMRHKITPNSSPATAKTKSVCPSGSMRFTVPSPGPVPNQPPLRKELSAMSIWYVSPESGLRKRSMRLCTWETVK